MKKIIISMILAVSLITFIGCNNNNAEKPVVENPTVDNPAELLKNIPVTEADLKEILNANGSRNADSNEDNEKPADSDLYPFILKTIVSETEGFEFGKNKTLGVIGTFSDTAKKELTKIYGDQTDNYLKSFAVRDFGYVLIDMKGNKATIYWYMPENQDDEMTFPECSIYINGTYKNGKYESIELYGENCDYERDSSDELKAYRIYEKKYVSGDKVISKSVTLKDSTLTNNQVNVIEITASGKTESKVASSDDLPKQSDIDGFSQKISEWKKSLN